MKTIKRRHFLTSSGLTLASLTLTSAHATLPGTRMRTLQIVVPAPAGSQPDLIARWLVEPLAQRAGVPGVVLNRPGAAGAVAVDAVLAAAPETGTVLLGGLDHVAYSHLNSNRRALDPLVDFVPVGAVNRDTWVLVSTADRGQRKFTTIHDLAFRRPSLSYASTGEGSTGHLLTARLCQTLGVDGQHVPYRESYLPDLLAGRVDFALVPTPSVMAQLQAGRLEATVTLTESRLPQLPRVPSVLEAGWPDQVFYGGLFLFAPATLSAQAPEINRWLREALQEPQIEARYRATGIEPTPIGLEEVRKAVLSRLRRVDEMRLAVFGHTR